MGGERTGTRAEGWSVLWSPRLGGKVPCAFTLCLESGQTVSASGEERMGRVTVSLVEREKERERDGGRERERERERDGGREGGRQRERAKERGREECEKVMENERDR